MQCLFINFMWLRENLLKYSVHTAEEAHKTGIPMMRPLPMVFPKDKEAVYWEDEYFMVPNLLNCSGSSRRGKEEEFISIRKMDQFIGFQKMVGGNRIFRWMFQLTKFLFIFGKERAFCLL